MSTLLLVPAALGSDSALPRDNGVVPILRSGHAARRRAPEPGGPPRGPAAPRRRRGTSSSRSCGDRAQRAVEADRRGRSSRAPTTRTGGSRARRTPPPAPAAAPRPSPVPARRRPHEQVLQPQPGAARPGGERRVPEREADHLRRPRPIATCADAGAVLEQRAVQVVLGRLDRVRLALVRGQLADQLQQHGHVVRARRAARSRVAAPAGATVTSFQAITTRWPR